MSPPGTYSIAIARYRGVRNTCQECKQAVLFLLLTCLSMKRRRHRQHTSLNWTTWGCIRYLWFTISLETYFVTCKTEYNKSVVCIQTVSSWNLISGELWSRGLTFSPRSMNFIAICCPVSLSSASSTNPKVPLFKSRICSRRAVTRA